MPRFGRRPQDMLDIDAVKRQRHIGMPQRLRLTWDLQALIYRLIGDDERANRP